MSIELPDGWRDELPEDIKTNGVLDDIKTIDQMAKMVIDARAFQSNALRIPSDDAAPEKREEFLRDLQTKIPDLVYVGKDADMSNIYDRMGRPKDPAEYELPDIPDPLKENFAGLAKRAHEVGVTKSQMKAISETILGDFNDNSARQTNALEDAVKEIKREYGEAFDKRLSSTAEFAKKIGFDESLVAAVSKGHVGLENMKALEKLMVSYGSTGPRIGDDPGNNENGRLSPHEAELRLNEIMNNKEHAWWDASNPAHKAAVMKVVELTRAADAGKEMTESEKFREALLGDG